MHVESTQVTPFAPYDRTNTRPPVAPLQYRRRRHRYIHALQFEYSCLLWTFFFLLILGQGLGVVWSTTSSMLSLCFGQSPYLGLYTIVGTNDIPFTDRSFVCSRRGRIYQPVALDEALDAPTSIVVDTTGSAVNGYRAVRRSTLTIDSAVLALYENTCNLISGTIDSILDRCEELGYDVTRDGLRIVDGVNSTTMKLLSTTLPALAMPFSDNSLYSRCAVPGVDGSACVIHLNGAYETKGLPNLMLRALNRSVCEQKTIEFLKRPGGVWRNGWYEEKVGGAKWYSDFLSSDNASLPGIIAREFDMLTNTERDCINTNVCAKTSRTDKWGAMFTSTNYQRSATTLTISNEVHYGLFMHAVSYKHVIESKHDLGILISNLSLELLLFRWLAALIALFKGYQVGTVHLQSVGIGVLSCARSFHWLPILLLPRLKMNLAVFSSTGCVFEGSQRALADAWLDMYPSIAEFVIAFFSVLNLVAKVLRRRVSDSLFGPTLLFFCAMHWFRDDLAQSGWFEYDGRIVTLVSSAELDRVSLLDFFRSDILLRLNGNIRSLFSIKLSVLALNFLPFLWSQLASPAPAGKRLDIEEVLALHLPSAGGLGAYVSSREQSPPHKSRSLSASQGAKEQSHLVLSGYELLRLGYLVLGDDCLLSFHDWYLLALLEAARVRHLSVARVLVFIVVQEPGGLHIAAQKPLLCRSNHPRVVKHSAWDVSVRSFR